MGNGMRVKMWIVSWVGWFFIWFIGKTSKIRVINSPGFKELKKENENFIYALWHGKQLLLLYSQRFQNIFIMISKSRDGDYIAQIIKHFGHQSIRGSSSDGGVKALIKMKREIEQGANAAFTPDGPRGPFHKVQPGVIYLAQKTGRPIIPLTFVARHKKNLKNWDKFVVPYPFNYIVVISGDPLYVLPEDDIEVKGKELEDRLNDITKTADNLVQN